MTTTESPQAIRFRLRVWDTDRHMLIPSDQILCIQFNNDKLEWVGCWIVTADQDGDPQQEQMQITSPVLMQSTGLLDKNGKEIFEGDILRKADTRNGVYLFREQPKHNVVVEWSEKKCGFRWDGFGIFANPERVEVIGNIYENPELLQ